MKNVNKKKNKKNRKITGQYGLTQNSFYSSFQNTRFSFLDPHLYVTLKYKETFSNSVTTGAGSQQSMNLNSLFDPNRTGSGHQPYGFDQLAALYNRYRVLKARYKVRFGALASAYHVVVGPTNGLLVSSITDQASYQTACEMPFARSAIQSPNADSVVITGTIAMNKLNGVTITEFIADDRFEAAVGSSPTELMILVVGTFNPTGGTLVPYYDVEIDYFVDFHDPIALASS